MLDLHCHIIPGVDDGARDLDEARAMLDCANALGVTHIVATPHVKRADADFEAIAAGMKKIRPHAQELGITLLQGYEFNIQALEQGDFSLARRCCIEGTEVLLTEFPFDDWPANWKDIVYALQAQGLTLVIAHPERYLPLQRRADVLQRLIDMNCLFQVNASAFRKRFGPKREVLRRLRGADRLHFIASDAHGPEDYALLEKAYCRIGKGKSTPQFLEWERFKTLWR